MMEVTERPLSHFTELLRKRTPFAFSRWGDGEWKSVTGKLGGSNCDGHEYFKGMGQDLARVLRSRPPYLLGLQPLAMKVMGESITSWMTRNKLTLPWINADVFHKASGKGELGPLLEVLNQAPRLIVVGPPHLARIRPLVRFHHFVTVPPKNAYLSWYDVFRDTLSCAENAPLGTVISISASMPAKLLVDALYKRLGTRQCILDVGSLWDPYVGVKSRRYMKDMNVEVNDGNQPGPGL